MKISDGIKLLAIVLFIILFPISAFAIDTTTCNEENNFCNTTAIDITPAPGPGVIPSQPGPGIIPSNPCVAGAGKICDPLGERFGTVPELIKTILEGVIKIGLPIVALAVVFSGFLFVFARGNSEKLTKAKDALLYTLIGAAILLGSWAIAKMIQTTVLSL